MQWNQDSLYLSQILSWLQCNKVKDNSTVPKKKGYGKWDSRMIKEKVNDIFRCDYLLLIVGKNFGWDGHMSPLSHMILTLIVDSVCFAND